MGYATPEQTAAWAALDAARASYHEDPAGAMSAALRAERVAAEAGDPALRGRALALQTFVTIHGGGLRAGFPLAAAAEVAAEAAGHPVTTVEVAAMGAHLAFFSGSYREALRQAERCVAVADAHGDTTLRIFARRQSCMVFGNLDAPEWPGRLDELLALTMGAGDRWEEAISRNDLAHMRNLNGDNAGAMAEIARGIAVAETLAPRNRFALGVLRCTRADIHLAGDRVPEALADARAALAHLSDGREPNPYIYGMSVCVEVRALLAMGAMDEATAAGRAGVARLHRTVPQIRAMILQDIAAALRAGGRAEEAYDALADAAELERLAFRELTELQRDFERAVAEHGVARAKNEELERTVAQLAEAHRELEQLQARLREQAERDWLTGLFNRRYLAGVLEAADARTGGELLSVAALDLDHFKAINDRFGHEVGDRVLARAAELLQQHVRAGDVVARTGGEEFVVVMPGADERDAVACAERLRAAIASDDWAQIAPGLAITASIGVVSAAATRSDDVIRAADRRLYAAKEAGRNRVVTTG
ncbi:GGDEF domain-containing protein [Conexibacter woesei]|uniref:GGDEF domain-containing protein n=1 Tax=Conexibacter woesei TaxID=191495 RepID=UPI000685478F|nr:GGDEF domain-containing protein [Conexibacter woesei]